MKKVLAWLARNIVTIILLLAVVFLYLQLSYTPFHTRSSIGPEYMWEMMDTVGYAPTESYGLPSVSYRSATPQMDVADRKTVTHSNLSLLVSNVRESLDKIEEETKERGGYVVRSTITTPETGASGHITVRVPDEEFPDVLKFMREMAVKVVHEEISGHDITDQYIDIEERLLTLYTTREIYEGMLARADTVEEILKVQQHIFRTQDQIDSLTGQLNYMDATSSSTLITAYLSTDELALPYTPDKVWRPELVFKQAVRSMLSAVQDLGTAVIWVAVYAPVWAPLLVGFLIIRKVVRRRNPNQ
jgi:hypothetical protein